MGRPKVHDERTRVLLLDAAEQLVEREGPEALSLRRLADEVGRSTRAVYSLFGSRAGLVDALGGRAFDWLADALDAQPLTADPVADLVEAGVCGFRRLVVEHPALFRLAVQRQKAAPGTQTHTAAEHALAGLLFRLERLRHAGLIAGQSVHTAAWQFHALCEGLAALELRGSIPAEQEQQAWRDALMVLVSGMVIERGAPVSLGSSSPTMASRSPLPMHTSSPRGNDR